MNKRPTNEPPVTLRAWAERYGTGHVIIGEWKKKFKAALNIEAPLHDASEMFRRWPEVSREKCPPAIVRNIGIIGPPSAVSSEPVSLAFTGEQMDAAFNYNDSVLIAEKNLRACGAILDKAIEAGNVAEIRAAQPAYKDASETLRKTKLASAKISKDDGDSFDAATVRNEIYRLHASIPKTLRTRLKDDISTFLRANVTPSIDQLRTAVDTAIDAAFAHLAESAFLADA